MADMDREFRSYYQRIKLSSANEDRLRRGRDALRNRIRSWFINTGKPVPKFCWQGSFAMKTTINLWGQGQQYDIDDGIYLSYRKKDLTASRVHGWIIEAVADHTESIINKDTCIRVNYSAGYHIDLPIYVMDGDNAYLAHKTKGWVLSDPKAFRDWFIKKVKNNSEQLRRIVLYLKGWKTNCSIPLKGIEITILVSNCYQRNQKDDEALYDTVSKIIETLNMHFSCVKPVQPYEDLFGCISENRKNRILDGLYGLQSSLLLVQITSSNIEAINSLKTKFGNIF
ncbi:hypothetical protein SELR_17340 [Selenomonas ruminantium subsp. lactilytica TAM6421]|uniref:Cyclic GMP-AMP synthase n=1 Tax=Selenomonas ruminantium subsp. lactilytica (strain NBRC 103574 / TAM6421) TaxID=927704 RepID=I0GRQ5_SELRL|nr:hypothetical protein [Selenomonas ruminantium]BAL83442.1 hypothetical protein SELR_17340 [Selenomonas ruminantium subsp. lactilytica TAM6421]